MRALFKYTGGLRRFFSQPSSVSEDFIKRVIATDKATRQEPRAKPEPPKKREDRENRVATTASTETENHFTVEEEKTTDNRRSKITASQKINFHPIKVLSEADHLIETQYGALRIPDKFKMSSLTNMYYLVNSSNVNFVLSALKKDKVSLLLFPPVTSTLLEHLREEC